MTKNEAINAMKAGEIITHRLFDSNEWMRIIDGNIVFEDGCEIAADEFWGIRNTEDWDDGYSIVNDLVDTHENVLPLLLPYTMCPNKYYDWDLISDNDGKHVSKYARRRKPTKYEGAERNKPCPCGSGIKFKRCCEGKEIPEETEK